MPQTLPFGSRSSQSPEKASLVLSRLKSALFPIQASPDSHTQLTSLNPRVHQSRPARPLPSNLVFLAPTVACSSGTLLSSWSALLLDAFQTQSSGKPEECSSLSQTQKGPEPTSAIQHSSLSQPGLELKGFLLGFLSSPTKSCRVKFDGKPSETVCTAGLGEREEFCLVWLKRTPLSNHAMALQYSAAFNLYVPQL